MGLSRERLFMLVVLISVSIIASVPSKADDSSLTLDLDRCVDIALEVNFSVLIADYELDQRENDVLTSASAILPTVSVVSRNSRYQEFRDRWEANQFIESDRSYYASLDLEERLSLGGVMGTLEALALRRAGGEDLRGTRQDIAFEAKQKYFEVLKTQRLLAVREEALDLSGRRLEKAEAMVEVGSAVRSDVLRAQVEVSSNKLELISAQNALRLAETDLRHFLRLEDDTELVLEDILETEDMEYTMDSALSTSVDYRPDIRSARHSLGAARYSVWAQRGGWFPNLSFSAGYLYQGVDFPDELGWFRDYSEWEWRIALSMNLFDGFYTFSRVRSAKAYRRIAEENLLEVMRNAALEVRKAVYNVDEAQQRVEVSKETVAVAEEELRLSEERYRLGAGTMLEQIDSQVALSEARTSHIEALYDLLLSQASLVRAMGRE